MGWDNSMQRQGVMSFLLDLMEIDPNQLLHEALQAKMAEAGLTYESAPAINGNGEPREAGDGMYEVFQPDVITLSDGRVFIETQTETTQGDDWGNDYYTFVEAGKPFTFTRNDWLDDGNDPHVTTEEMISTFNLPDPDTKGFGAMMPEKWMGKTPAEIEELGDEEDADTDSNIPQHHELCNDLTRCHPFCALAQEQASEDTVVSTAHIVLKPEVVFGPEVKSFTPDEVRDQGGVFGEFVADYMEDHGLDHISFETGDEEDV